VCTHERCRHRPHFSNAGALARHESTHGVVAVVRQKKRTRRSYSVRFKSNSLRHLWASMLKVCDPCSRFVLETHSSDQCPSCGERCVSRVKYEYIVADELGIDKSMLSRWKSEAEQWLNAPSENGFLDKLKRHDGRALTFPVEEEALFCSFTNMRKCVGLPVDCYWLQAEMLELVEQTRGPDHGFAPSNQWAHMWCKRWGVTSQMKNEKKHTSAEERRGSLDRLHVNLAYVQSSLPQRCPIWGAFRPCDMWNADHVPLPFVVNYLASQ
jgi:RNA polymerase subunit RPABC4/transcription elongation factor Spt4